MLDGTMATMNMKDIAAAAEAGAGILLPIGVIEAHGPHLPTGTDIFIATKLCELVRQYSRPGNRDWLLAPPFYWGINGILGRFSGSFDIRPQTARALLTDMVDSLLADGFRDILFVSHHGDRAHNDMLVEVLRAAHERGATGVRWLYAPSRWRMFERLGLSGTEPFLVPWSYDPRLDRFRTTGILGVHADEYETAAIVRYFPETVDYEALENLEPTRLEAKDLAEWRTGDAAARRLTPDAYFGAPNPVDPDLWRYYDETARIMAAALVAEEAARAKTPHKNQ